MSKVIKKTIKAFIHNVNPQDYFIEYSLQTVNSWRHPLLMWYLCIKTYTTNIINKMVIKDIYVNTCLQKLLFYEILF